MKRILTSIWFLALIITIPIVAMLPPVFSKYKISLDSIERRAGIKGKVLFSDLQNDGQPDRVESFRAEQDLLAFQCFTPDGKLFNQFNFPFKFVERLTNLFFFDVDNDGLQEVYGFTAKQDSVFMSWVEPYDTLHPFHTYFVATIDTRRRTDLDVSVHQMEYFDFDGDGNKEMVFGLIVGYNWFPRKLFVFHPDTGILESSEEFGVHFSALAPFDLNADGTTELLCVGSSAENITADTKVKYHDDRPRLFVFNSDLKTEFPPVEFPSGIASRIYYDFLDKSKGELLVLYHNYSSENPLSFVTKVKLGEEQQASDTLFLEGDLGNNVGFQPLNDSCYAVLSGTGKVFYFDRDLKLRRSLDLNFKSQNLIRTAFDLSGKDNLVFFTHDLKNQFHIFQDHFNDELILKPELPVDNSSVIVQSPVKDQFMVINYNSVMYYSLNYNSFYWLKYPLYLLIYLVIASIIWLWQKASTRQLKEKYELQNQVRDLRLKSFRNQLNPHFIFNTFNGVASVIKKGDTNQAYEVFMRFSRMTRTLLDNFDDTLIALGQEMEMVRNFIELQKFRFKELFDYELNMADRQLNDIMVPRMIIQVHVENAIRHGIVPKGAGGFLKVDVRLENTTLRITIEDNGIGREKSAKLKKESIGLGLKTIQSVIDEINAGRKQHIVQEIHDLKDSSGSAMGTRIELFIPVELTNKT